MNHHALIIDDNLKNLSVLARLLSEQEVTSTQITNPRLIDQTLAVAGKIDVVFVDLEMPGLNGYDVLHKLKADEKFIGVPIVAYTVHVSEINQAHRGGFDGFVGKPLDPDRFPDQLARLLRHEQVWETA
ncbi:MAG: response regulator [Chloroflexi bacterium]|nr:response regulator [Chloroflexota bacterium]